MSLTTSESKGVVGTVNLFKKVTQLFITDRSKTVLLLGFAMLLVTGPEFIKLFSCSTQLSLKFILLINVKMPTIFVGILTFISRINGWL